MSGGIDRDDEFLLAACEAVRRTPGDASLDALDWWDMVDALDDDGDARRAVFALFRAQGRELGASNALASLLGRPFAPDAPRGSVSATITSESGLGYLLVGEPPSKHVVIDVPGRGAYLMPVARLRLRPIELPGRVVLNEVEFDWEGLPAEPTIAEDVAARARARSRFLGRVAVSFEMLGAAETTVSMAVDYVRVREQFGQPIGTFQAVRHLLAWARTDCAAIEAVAHEVVRLDRAVPAGWDEVCKALAGRNGRRACERTLQCFGAIGFTDEHLHHHFHSRVLTYDALLGTGTELTRRLGRRSRGDEPDERVAATLLMGGDASTTM